MNSQAKNGLCPPASDSTERNQLPWPLQELFRGLVVFSTVAYLLVVFSPWLFYGSVSPETYDVLSWNGVGAVLPVPAGLWWLLVMLWVAVAFGLWQFNPQARIVFLALTGFDLVVTLLGGMMARLPFEAFLGTAATLADGAILALAYYSTLKERFESGVPRPERGQKES